MRTTGTFADVYGEARRYYNGRSDDCPMDAVVRRVRGEWRLESGINPEADADFECSLSDVFDAYFHESYSDPDWTPADEDIEEFVRLMQS